MTASSVLLMTAKKVYLGIIGFWGNGEVGGTNGSSHPGSSYTDRIWLM